jgi:hypothetical protein
LKRHLKNKEFALLVGELLNVDKAAEFKKHISVCQTCRAKHSKLLKLTKPSLATNIKPDNSLHQRILQSYFEIKKSHIEKNKTGNWSLLKPAAAISLAIVLIITAFFYHNNYSYTDIKISATHIKGEVLLNNAPLSQNSETKTGVVTTGNTSYVKLNYKNIFQIKVSENTKIAIEESVQNESDKKNIFKFKLYSGDLISITDHRNTNFSYTITTPHASFTPLGTNFLLSSSNKESTLILTEGRVLISNLQNKKSITAKKDNKYIVSFNTAKNKISTLDLEKYQTITKQFEKYKARKSNNNSTFSPDKFQLRKKDNLRELQRNSRKDLRKKQRSKTRQLQRNRYGR